jgi:hypothetical protein
MKNDKRHGRADSSDTDMLCSYGAAMKEIGKKPVAGKTTRLRTDTSHLEEGSLPCLALRGCEPCKNLPPSTLMFTTSSIKNAFSASDQISG